MSYATLACGLALIVMAVSGCTSGPNETGGMPAPVKAAERFEESTTKPSSDELPVVGEPHRTDSPKEVVKLDLPAHLASPDWQRLTWTFFTGVPVLSQDQANDRYAIWLNDELIYHNEIAPAQWIPGVRHFESDRLVNGMHEVRVLNLATGERCEHQFDGEETAHIVIFARATESMAIRSFPNQIHYR